MLHLIGLPRISEGGMRMTANLVNINRRSSGEVIAEGNVKSTYSDIKAQPNGAMLASSDPIHVTAKKMTAHRDTGIALYTGGSRLWQGAIIVASLHREARKRPLRSAVFSCRKTKTASLRRSTSLPVN
jgi:hypothetical protein